MIISVALRIIDDAATAVALDAVVEAAKAKGVRISVAIVDSSGVLAGFLRMPGAFLQSGDIAIDKAKTAAGFRMSSSGLFEILEGSKGLLYGIAHREACAAFAGGLPLYDGEDLIGAVGVSGASEDEDLVCAQAAVKWIEKMEKR